MEFNGINAAMSTLCNRTMSLGLDTSPRGMKIKELIAPKIVIQNPRNRIVQFEARSADMVYLFAEMIWYISGTNSLNHIAHYAPSIKNFSDDDKTLNSAYGYCIWKKFGNQWDKAVEILKKDRDSRQAIILIRSPEDLFLNTKDSICTISLQFLIRDERLYLITNMRSQDLFVGFLYDAAIFSMFQCCLFERWKFSHIQTIQNQHIRFSSKNLFSFKTCYFADCGKCFA